MRTLTALLCLLSLPAVAQTAPAPLGVPGPMVERCRSIQHANAPECHPAGDVLLDGGHVDISGSVVTAIAVPTFMAHGLVGFTGGSGAQVVASVWPTSSGYRLHFALQGFFGGGSIPARGLTFPAAGAALLLELGDNNVALGGMGPSIVCSLVTLPAIQQCTFGWAFTGTYSAILARLQ